MFKNKIIKTAAILGIVFSTNPLFAGTFYVKINIDDKSKPYDEDSREFIPPAMRDQVMARLFYTPMSPDHLSTLFWGQSSGSRIVPISMDDVWKEGNLEFSFETQNSSTEHYLLDYAKNQRLKAIPLTNDDKQQLRSLTLTLRGRTGQISDLDYGEPNRTW